MGEMGRYALLVRPGGHWDVLRLDTDVIRGTKHYVVIAEARDEQAAREIAAGLNAQGGAR